MPKENTNLGDKDRRADTAKSVFGGMDRELGDAARARGADERTLLTFKRRLSILEQMLNITTGLNSTLNLEDLLTKVVDAVVDITGCKRGYLMLAKDGGGLDPVVGRSSKGGSLSLENLDLSLSVIQRAADLGVTQLVANAQEEADLRDKRSIVDGDIHTVISIPLQFEENLVGVIYADNDRISGRFVSADLPLLNAFGVQAAGALENARRHGELEGIRESLERQNITLRHELAERYEFSGMVGRSKALQRIFQTITKVAPHTTTVLIQGETGTGKELIAKAIHFNSTRRGAPLVSINCGALPKDILESELFGYVAGAFTGANNDRPGLFEAANSGTLFLDEIGDMPVELQVKLLRALQEGEVRRLGEDRSRKVDVRVVAATNKDLTAEVEAGGFRKDLYFRLNVVPIFLPPLRDRQEDILPLAEFFVDKFAKRMGMDKPTLVRSARELLLNHSWTGNVRELENAIERALALGEGRSLSADHFSHLIEQQGPGALESGEATLKTVMESQEKSFIRKMLIKNSWNVSRTASTIKISRQQLHNKIKKFGLHPEI